MPVFLSTHQNESESSFSGSKLTLKKIRSSQTIGVAALRAGISSFQATLSSVLQVTGRFSSGLRPSSVGPRH